MGQIKLNYYEALAYIALAGLVIGILLGLIPLILGLRKNKRSYGLYGLVTSIVAGVFSPILSIIAVAIFTWLILRKPQPENSSAEVSADSDIS